MVIRIIGVAIVGLALVLVGCGADTASAPPPAPISTLSDDDQIREVLTEAIDATSNWDDAKMAELSCAELRDAVTFDYMVPPMSTFPRDKVASIGPEQFANNLAEQFTGASDESVLGRSRSGDEQQRRRLLDGDEGRHEEQHDLAPR